MSAQRPIPKFASFRPKLTAEDSAQATNAPGKSKLSALDHKERRHHHNRHRSRSKEKSPRRATEATPSVTVTTGDTSELFIEDRRGDTQNLIYGSIHHYSIPSFHRIGAGSVLGVPRSIKIARNGAEEKGIVLSDRREESIGKREKYAFARNEKKASRLLRIRPDTCGGAAGADNLDFIALSALRPRKRIRLSNDSNHSSDDDKQHYRSIEGRAKAGTEPLDEWLEYVTDSNSSDLESGRRIVFDETIRQKNIELSRRVDEHPEDVEAWIALIGHQDTLLGRRHEEHRKVTNAERRSTADIKLHLYEKALAKAGSTLENRERLLLGLIAEGSKIWEFKTQSERWEQVSQDNLDSVLLWKQYLDFRQCSFATFRYEEVRGIFVKRIKLLVKVIGERQKSETGNSVLYEHLLYTVLRATLFIREAGYSELAIAIWQALLELNFLGPPHSVSSSSRLDVFQEFWESEVARIGEEGAKGWRNSSEDAEVPDEKKDEKIPSKYLTSSDMFGDWAIAEKLRAAASREPARTVDEVTDDNPYRVILWSDIQDYMIDLSSSFISTGIRRLLLDAFLIFCRLPPMPASDGRTLSQWWTDSFTRGEMLDCSIGWIDDHFVTEYSLEEVTAGSSLPSEMDRDRKRVGRLNPFELPAQCFAGSEDTLFPMEYWTKYLLPWRSMYTNLSPSKSFVAAKGPIKYNWVRNALKSLVMATQIDNLAEYYLAFEYCNEPQDIKKVAKGLLKQNPQSLRLYNAYAMIEWHRGNKAAATNVITAALGMRAPLSEKEQQDSILLWKTWAWTLLNGGDNAGALKCLFSIPDGKPVDLSIVDVLSPANLLKTKQHISANRDYSLSSDDLHHAILHAECLALVEYLSSTSGKEPSSKSQGDIASALAVFNNFSETMMARGHGLATFHETFLQAAARLLYHHVRSGPFRPALLRTHLTRSLTIFPRNTIFTSLYTWNESRLRIDDKTRTILRSVILTETNENIIGWLFAIRYEMTAGNVHSTHATFENAVSSPNCQSNPGLWRLYILFCVRMTQFNSKAKDVFYRAMRACPWAKELAMMAFIELRGSMGFEELRSVYNVLVEKELRVHVDLEDKFEDSYEREAGTGTIEYP